MQTRKETVKSSTTKTTYVSKDGKEFTSESQCQSHEDYLDVRKLEQRDVNLYPFVSIFYHINSDETLNLLLRSEFEGETETILGNKIKIRDWVAVRYGYNPNGADDYDLLTMDELMTAIGDKK